MDANVSMELMQQAILTHVIRGLKGVQAIADNLIICVKDLHEHDENLRALLERLWFLGSKIGLDSILKMGKEGIKIFGLKVSATGIAIGDEKAEALLNAARTGTPSESHQAKSIF